MEKTRQYFKCLLQIRRDSSRRRHLGFSTYSNLSNTTVDGSLDTSTCLRASYCRRSLWRGSTCIYRPMATDSGEMLLGSEQRRRREGQGVASGGNITEPEIPIGRYELIHQTVIFIPVTMLFEDDGSTWGSDATGQQMSLAAPSLPSILPPPSPSPLPQV